MPLSQVQIIRSLGEALAWFERELVWGVPPAELRHLTGRIGELYAAMITRGQMALAVNQRGYDVVSAEGQRVSVKTVTSSNHVVFNKATLGEVDQAMVLRFNVVEGEASIEELFRGTVAELVPLCKDAGGALTYSVKGPPSSEQVSLDRLKVTGEAFWQDRRVVQYENGTITVDVDGLRAPAAMPVLKEIAASMGVSPLNGAGNPMNTRQLGAAIIAASAAGVGMSPAGKFAWGDGDVVALDEDGNEMTTRQVKEAQLIYARSQVAEDVEADLKR